MIHTFSINIDTEITLDLYESFLSKFNNWKEYKRELRLSNLLNEGKKLEFTVDIENHPHGCHYIEFDEHEKLSFDTNLSSACGSIKSAKFILNNNIVESLDIEVMILDTYWGRTVKQILESKISLTLKQFFAPKYVKFYITIPNKSEIREENINKILKK
jgi:hypothetical protein